MGLASFFGLGSERKIRYAIVALGDIVQEAMLPGIAHTGNSTVTAFVSGDPSKAKKVAERYGVEHTYSYDQFEEMLNANVADAIYLATPNFRHAEFAIPALRKGVHVLLEKPMEVSVEKCLEIQEAQLESGAKLMIAYRLHFEPATLDAIQTIRDGDLGDVRLFTSTFSQMVDPKNHRAQNGVEAGPLFDMGPYPINAARYIFGCEPTEVVYAVATRTPNTDLGDIDDTVAATLRFPGDRLAQFVVSYASSAIDTFTVVGTQGSLIMNPAFTYGKGLEQDVEIDGKKVHRKFKSVDQFGGEMKYFSDCILNDVDPEPDGEEGYADLRVIEGIQKAIETGRPQILESFERSQKIDTKTQLQKLSPRTPPSPIGASSPSRQ